ncbi:hypothetical protein SB861_50540 [Paraburkholderia sp. SIMBA_049]
MHALASDHSPWENWIVKLPGACMRGVLAMCAALVAALFIGIAQ